MSSVECVAIIGASAAGVSVAEALRRHGFEKEIVLIGDEQAVPYDRPPLSKQVLSGVWDASRAALLPAERLDAIGATHRHGVSARALRVRDRVVVMNDGSEVHFDEAVIATGVRPRQLPGAMATNVFTLRTLDDANRLREAFGRGTKLLIVGGGFLGLEVAATARGLGLEVTVVEPTEEPLANRLGPTTSRRLLDLHRENEVDIRVGRSVREFLVDASHTPGIVQGAVLDDGSIVSADAVLVAIGTVPNVEWLHDSGLELSDGVECDSFCQAAPHVWAAGDVARWTHNGIGRSLRLEHRTNATEQGENVAKNIMGQAIPYTPVPYVWTDHYGIRLQTVGFMPAGCTETTHFGDLDGGPYVRRFEHEQRTVGAVAWNAAKALLGVRRELADTFANLSTVATEAQ
jgi:3-phenylpropionate/trans-cinnamate dioxygenase ferredoxin reductase subunit